MSQKVSSGAGSDVNEGQGFIVAGLHFRNEMEVGPGGEQILLEDPDGNPIELFEPAR